MFEVVPCYNTANMTIPFYNKNYADTQVLIALCSTEEVRLYTCESSGTCLVLIALCSTEEVRLCTCESSGTCLVLIDFNSSLN